LGTEQASFIFHLEAILVPVFNLNSLRTSSWHFYTRNTRTHTIFEPDNLEGGGLGTEQNGMERKSFIHFHLLLIPILNNQLSPHKGIFSLTK